MENTLNEHQLSSSNLLDNCLSGDIFEDLRKYRYIPNNKTYNFEVGTKKCNTWEHVGILQPSGLRAGEILTKFSKGLIYGKYFK